MDSRELQYVIAVAQTHSFSQAAKLVMVSQPALSQYIRRLEHRLGCTLFYRNTQKVELTPAGKVFVERAQDILGSIHNLEKEMEKYRWGKHNLLTIGASQFYGKYVLAPMIDVLRSKMPESHIQITEGRSELLESQIVLHKLDIGIFPEPIYHQEISFLPIYEEYAYFAFSEKNKEAVNIAKSAWDGDKIDLYAFRHLPFVLLRKGLKFHDFAEAICSSFHFQPRSVYESDNLDTVYTLINHNYGVGFLPSTLLPSIDEKRNHVRFYPITSPLARRRIGIAYLTARYKKKELESVASIVSKEIHRLLEKQPKKVMNG
ncbi:MAG: LysR family transcriptional regulator [Acidaminococcus sp.]|nr:LysR family transcriptional regulator [Acidaminococcus sp.]MCI2100250.1 LysR family transcriptional regulator [Acidaminococcus sp.]MCI2114570.1 LysR family transcriptional regulator [Acidaminococcus sp.]MCI2116547.1 LysR family transcriptional regulator [Acidaminococcus sp.]